MNRRQLLASAIGITTSITLLSQVPYLKNRIKTLLEQRMNYSYEVTRVIDGDTFETKEKQRIRLAGVSAPETGLCGHSQAKELLERLTLNKKVQIKVSFIDIYRRQISYVYVGDKFVNLLMLKSGWTFKGTGTSEKNDLLLKTTQEANKRNIGIFSDLCSQMVNKTRPFCNVKGNRDSKFYHYPGCGQYNNVIVELHRGDVWFCTREEAESAGFKRAKLCPLM